MRIIIEKKATRPELAQEIIQIRAQRIQTAEEALEILRDRLAVGDRIRIWEHRAVAGRNHEGYPLEAPFTLIAGEVAKKPRRQDLRLKVDVKDDAVIEKGRKLFIDL